MNDFLPEKRQVEYFFFFYIPCPFRMWATMALNNFLSIVNPTNTDLFFYSTIFFQIWMPYIFLFWLG